MCYTQNRFKALLSACVMSLIATASWSQSLTWLGTLGGNQSYAYAVSAGGAVVVGTVVYYGYDPYYYYERAFRWTASGGMQHLGTLDSLVSRAYGVSADGSVVVGESVDRAFRWTASRGMEDLNTTYASLLRGSALWEARAISPDVGEGLGVVMLIPIARAEFTIAPLLKVPPASRGEPRGARGFGSPCVQGEP